MRILEPLARGWMPSIERVREGRQIFAVGFRGRGLWAWLLLLFKHTFRNIMSILEPLYSSQILPIESVLEGRRFFVLFIEGIPFLSSQAQSGSFFWSPPANFTT